MKKLTFCFQAQAVLVILVTFSLFPFNSCHMYSEKSNSPDYNKLVLLDKPFRMQKLNLIWEKAVKKLPPTKLKQIHHDLKYQDKEELAWKKLKSENLDKDGLKEALIRGSFNAILEKYGLAGDFKALQDSVKNEASVEHNYSKEAHMKMVFKDKKLNKLWLKAEHQGFSVEQLKALKEEFEHHQNKIDQYYLLMDRIHKDPTYIDEESNVVEHVLQAEELKKSWKGHKSPQQALKEKHAELKEGYDYLHSQLIPNLKNMEFDEPQVNSLWEMAQNSTFTAEELESLKGELHHFEHRIKKLKTLTDLELEKLGDNKLDTDSFKQVKKIKEYNYKVEKIHKELSSRILQKHSEL